MTTVWLGPRVALFVLAALIVGCSGDDDVEPASTTTVQIVLMEWAVEPEVARVAPGNVTFRISNRGWVPHEFVVVRTDLSVDALPVARARVDERQVAVVGRVDKFFGMRETREITLTLEAGKYALICNSLGHYPLGVRTAFRVQ